jgi:hypothetical protein
MHEYAWYLWHDQKVESPLSRRSESKLCEIPDYNVSGRRTLNMMPLSGLKQRTCVTCETDVVLVRIPMELTRICH